MHYLKYYWLEKDFFPEIYKFFHDKGYLTPEHFFSIIIWKSTRPRKQIKLGLLADGKSLDDAVYNLTKKIYEARSKEERLEILIGDGNKKRRQHGFQLAMASAILTVLYPKDFTVYDFRVRGQLNDPENGNRIFPDISYRADRVKKYFDNYVQQVLEKGKRIANNQNLSMRDCDRLLWAKSWYEDLRKFLEK